MNRESPQLPLSGITVVSLEQAIAAPLASRHLADWGARVIKIERPGKGDFCRDYDYVMNGMSSQFAWKNTGAPRCVSTVICAASLGNVPSPFLSK